MSKITVLTVFILLLALCFMATVSVFAIAYDLDFLSNIFSYEVISVFVPIGNINFIRENISIEIIYVVVESLLIASVLVYILLPSKIRTVVPYIVSIFILLDVFLMWQATAYFSDRYGNVVHNDGTVIPTIDVLKKIKLPERAHVIFPSSLYDESVKPIWREWDLLLTANYPLYYGTPILAGSAMNLVPRYISDFQERLGLAFATPESDIDFRKVLLLGASNVILMQKKKIWNASFNLKTEGKGYQIFGSGDVGPRFYLVESVIPFKFKWEGSEIDVRFEDKNYDPVSFAFIADEDVRQDKRQFTYKEGGRNNSLKSTKYGLDFFESWVGKVSLIDYDWERVDFEAEIKSSALMVLTDTWYPGWKVYVDSKEEKIIRTNYIFRGVWLEPGNHQISFRFENILVKIGKILSVIGIVSIVFWGGIYNFGRRKNSC